MKARFIKPTGCQSLVHASLLGSYNRYRTRANRSPRSSRRTNLVRKLSTVLESLFVFCSTNMLPIKERTPSFYTRWLTNCSLRQSGTFACSKEAERMMSPMVANLRSATTECRLQLLSDGGQLFDYGALEVASSVCFE